MAKPGFNDASPMYGSIAFDKKVNEQAGWSNTQTGGRFYFDDLPLVGSNGGVATATSVHKYDNGLKLYVNNIGTQTGGIGPSGDDLGVDYSYDGANNEGIQWALADPECRGYWTGPGKQKYKIGSDPAFYAKLTFQITDVSDTDDLHFGFRKVEAFQAAVDDYDEAAGIGVVTGAGSSDGLQVIASILNDASTSETTTTESLSDGQIVSWTTKVSAAGVCTFEIDDAAPAATAAFTFDDGEIVTPFMYALHAAASAMGLILISFEHGYQE